MKNLKEIIIEKLVINKNLKSKTQEIMFHNISKYLFYWLIEKDKFRGIENNRFEFLEKVNYELMSLLDYFSGEIEEMSEKLQIPIHDLIKFIKNNNDKLVEQAKKDYKAYYNDIPF